MDTITCWSDWKRTGRLFCKKKKRHSYKTKTKTTVESRWKIERDKTISGIQQSKRTGTQTEGLKI
jgi:hypothetical protein